jgi:uncharacterized protein DUF5655
MFEPRPLWQCPRCGERFVNANAWHSCGKHTLEALFVGSEPHLAALFETFAARVRACGPVAMIPQKTRVVFQVRIRFAGVYPRKSFLLAGLLLPRRYDDRRFVKIEAYSPRNFGHQFRIASEANLDADFDRWLREAYKMGEKQPPEARLAVP